MDVLDRGVQYEFPLAVDFDKGAATVKLSDDYPNRAIADPHGVVVTIFFSHRPAASLRSGWRDYYRAVGTAATHVFLLHLYCLWPTQRQIEAVDGEERAGLRGLAFRALCAVLDLVPEPEQTLFMLEAYGTVRSPAAHKRALAQLQSHPDAELEHRLASAGLSAPKTTDPAAWRRELEDAVERMEANTELVMYYARKLGLRPVPLPQRDCCEVLMAAPFRRVIACVKNQRLE